MSVKYLVYRNKLLLILLIGFLLKLTFLPYARLIDPDAFSRIHLSEVWLEHPKMIYEGVWLPIHFYLNAFSIWITSDHVIGPKLLHILFSIATLVPLYHFTKREFNERGALIVCIAYLLSPIVFRNSYQALSGIPHAFFVACSMNFLSLALVKGNKKYAVYAGLTMTVAAGLRYEAWLLICAFLLVIAARLDFKILWRFLIPSMIFPVFWMIGNYITHGHPIYGVPGIYNSDVIVAQNDSVSTAQYINRLLFFPLSWFVLFSPILASLLLFHLVKRWRNRNIDLNRLLWILPFIVLFLAFISKAYSGTLLLQHRFSIILILLSVPFLALLFEENRHRKWKSGSFILGILLLPFVQLWFTLPVERIFNSEKESAYIIWNQRVSGFANLSPVPGLIDPEVQNEHDMIRSYIKKEDGLILDFDQWDQTGYLALTGSQKTRNTLFIQPTWDHAALNDELSIFLMKHHEGILLFKCDSKLESVTRLTGKNIHLNINDSIILRVDRFYYKDGINIFRYSIEEEESNGEEFKLCPDEGSLAYFRMKIKQNPAQLFEIKYKAFVHQRPFEEQLNLDAERLRENSR